MPSPAHVDRLRRLVGPVVTAVPVALVDLLSKDWAVEHLAGRGPVVLVPQFVRLELGVNAGVAFGMMEHRPSLWPIVAGAAVIAYLLWLAPRIPEPNRATVLGLGLMLGGAFGNLYDRIWRVVDDGTLWGPGIRRGVVDFISVGSWPAFNVADVALVLGAGLLLRSLWTALRSK
ncbi:MAG: signal peptidase II [Myxococcota bacterium]